MCNPQLLSNDKNEKVCTICEKTDNYLFSFPHFFFYIFIYPGTLWNNYKENYH